MRRDTIFYQLFQQSPSLLFELLTNPPTNVSEYKFDSVAVKEPKFEIDGVFLPPDNKSPGVVYFCEVQFQKDEKLYERIFAESLLYFYRNRDRFSDWQIVIIYPSRSTEQSELHPYRNLFNSDQVHRVYLDELGEIGSLPVWVALMVLTTLEPEQAPDQARDLLGRSALDRPEAERRAIIELITTIMVYKFERLSRMEVEAMLGIKLQQTRVYQEAKEEGRQEGEQQGRQEGEQRGRQEGERSLILRQLTRRLEELPQEVRSRVESLPLEQLENLGEALLDFQSIADLFSWLEAVGH